MPWLTDVGPGLTSALLFGTETGERQLIKGRGRNKSPGSIRRRFGWIRKLLERSVQSTSQVAMVRLQEFFQSSDSRSVAPVRVVA
ncbi:unnamed protein product [Mycena citricolor]|uniref:Uncharacterized protein n=1 Tax=Mycena citricolor TaxID=2018698 RepID=A0AAD2Q5S0_9AGAR|nr:unnamed protein product [Mycena citricolor]